VEILGTTVGVIVGVTIVQTVAPMIASCKRRLRHPLFVVTQAVVKNKARMQHMHIATTLRRRWTVRDTAQTTTNRRLPPHSVYAYQYWHTAPPLGPPTRSSQGVRSGLPQESSDVPTHDSSPVVAVMLPSWRVSRVDSTTAAYTNGYPDLEKIRI